MRVLFPVLALATAAAAQDTGTMDRPTGEVVPYAFETLDTGVVRVEGASWLRLYFAEASLSPGSFVRITSVLDNEVQELDAAALARWGNTSAYFNGDAVLVELIGGGEFSRNRLSLAAVAGPAPGQVAGGTGDCGICDADDRVPSGELWACRLLPAGCTASVFDEASCLVSAGHCVQGSMVVQFNVPDSNGDCSINNPPVADQYPILASESVNGGVGNDWAVLVPGANSLGELPFERYGQLRPIASSVPSPGVHATVWGYGVDNTCTTSQTQPTHPCALVRHAPPPHRIGRPPGRQTVRRYRSHEITVLDSAILLDDNADDAPVDNRGYRDQPGRLDDAAHVLDHVVDRKDLQLLTDSGWALHRHAHALVGTDRVAAVVAAR